MPKLQIADNRPTKKIVLPSSTDGDEAWVEVYTEALTGELEQLANAGENKGLAIVTGLANIIKAWNFEDETGKVAEINVENVRRLKQEDTVKILQEVDAYDSLNVLDPNQKKNTTPSS